MKWYPIIRILLYLRDIESKEKNYEEIYHLKLVSIAMLTTKVRNVFETTKDFRNKIMKSIIQTFILT